MERSERLEEIVMQTKISKLKQLMADGDHHKALKLAASWARLGVHKDAIQRGWAAMSNPRFYRQIGLNPDKLVAVGLQAICERYGIRGC